MLQHFNINVNMTYPYGIPTSHTGLRMNEMLLHTCSLARLLNQQDRGSSSMCCRSVCLDADRASYLKTLTLRSPALTTRGRTREPWRPHELRQGSHASSHRAMESRRHVDIEDSMVNGARSLGCLSRFQRDSGKLTETCCVAV